MTEDELDVAYLEGRLTKRAYVRQLLDRGADMAGALARAESVVPSPPPPEPAAEPPAQHRPVPTPGDAPVMSDDLDINFVGDGYVVYQPSRKRMHSLNHTAALVLELCTGDHDADAIATLLQDAFDLDEPAVDETDQCLRRLREEGLVR